MRKNENQTENRNLEVYCNACGKKLKAEGQMEMEGVFRGYAEWGYFSGKDGEIHTFDLCEACYDKWIASFQIPVQKSCKNELL